MRVIDDIDAYLVKYFGSGQDGSPRGCDCQDWEFAVNIRLNFCKLWICRFHGRARVFEKAGCLVLGRYTVKFGRH